MKAATVARCALVLAVIAAPVVTSAQPIPVPNGDFSLSGNAGSQTGTLLAPNYDVLMGTGPWHAQGTGILSLIASPNTTITSGPTGRATISGLASAGVLTVVNNSAEVYNRDIGSSFVAGNTYQLTANFTTSSPLANVAVLNTAGMGIGLTGENGQRLADTTGNPAFVNINLLPGNTSGTFSLLYTATAADAGDPIGIRLFAGAGSGIVNLNGLLGTVSFDNVALAVVAVPEPSTYALGGMLLLGAVGWVRHRRNRRAADALGIPQTDTPAV
jgi:hypothetical protein